MKKLHTTFLVLLLTFLSMQTCFAKQIKFVQVTDSHFSSTGNEATQRDVERSSEYLEKAISDINCVKNLDFVIFTGDNIDQANSDDLKLFIKKANKLNVPYYIVIGNHEVFKSQNLTKKEYMKIVSENSKSCKEKKPNYIFKKNGIVFIVVDGAKEIIPGPSGYYKKDTLKWLDKKLTDHRNDDVIIFQHFPLVEPYYNRSHTTYKADEYLAMLKKHPNVIAIFSGHYHANGENKKDGIYHASAPSLVEDPHNYKIVEIIIKGKNDCQIYTQLRHAE